MNPNDKLPEDAWVGFMDDRKGEKVSTRTNVFPFSIEQQKSILTVGACLNCHDQKSVVMESALYNFDSITDLRKPVCIVPVY